jgi:hypothetical protein
MEWRQKMGEPVRTPSVLRGALLVLVVAGGLAIAGMVGWVPHAHAADPAPAKDYIAVFGRGSKDQAFALLEKPRGAPMGAGTNIEIDAFGLRVALIDGSHAEAVLRRLPALDRVKSRQLPPGFKLYGDSQYVALSYADGSQKYRIIFTDPADAVGRGGGGAGAGGSAGGGMGGGGSM